jgi:hypothetical protein
MAEETEQQVNRIEESFRAALEAFDQHRQDHPDCEMFNPERYAITDESRITMLHLVNEAEVQGMLNPEEHLLLEMAIGSKGDPENGGWPATTGIHQIAATGAWLSTLRSALVGENVISRLAELLRVGEVSGDVEVMVIGPEPPPGPPSEEDRRGYL